MVAEVQHEKTPACIFVFWSGGKDGFCIRLLTRVCFVIPEDSD